MREKIIGILLVLSVLIVGCSNDVQQTNEKNIKDVATLNVEEKDTNNDIEDEKNNQNMKKNLNNLFNGIWVFSSPQENIYYKFRDRKVEFQSNLGCNMYYLGLEKVKENYKDNTAELTVYDVGDEEGTVNTVKFIGENEIEYEGSRLQRLKDKKEASRDLAKAYGVDFESLEAFGLDEFLDLSRVDFFENFGIYIYDYNVKPEEQKLVDSNMSVNEAEQIIKEYIESNNPEALKVYGEHAKAGNKLGYGIVVEYGDINSDYYGGRAEYFVDSKTGEIGEFMTGMGYYTMLNEDEYIAQ